MHFDTAVDWVVHSLFFVALGIGHARLVGEELWGWMGWIAALGGTINYVLVLILAAFDILWVLLPVGAIGPRCTG